MSSPTATIEDLPAEMIRELFKFLNLKDLVACAPVNKRWYSIFVTLKPDRLAVFDKFKFCEWNYPARKVKQKELCPLVVFNRFVGKPFLSNLKHLTLCAREGNFNPNKLNRLSYLVHLEIEVRLNETQVNLKLPKLKVLVAPSFSSRRSLLIDCPELEVLIYNGDGLNSLQVKHPETIKKLETNMVGPGLDRFRNVECLMTNEFNAIRQTTLLSLPKLKELHYNAGISDLWILNQAAGTLDRVKGVLLEFLDDVKRLKESDFKFTFAGFQLTNTMLDQIDFGVQVTERNGFVREEVFNEYVYMKNYELLNPGALHFIDTVDYNSLMRNAPGELPDCFTQKFSRIEKVNVEGAVRSKTRLLRFLRSLSWLRTLELDRPPLSQKFYDKLPVSAHSLTKLTLSGCINQYMEIKRGNVKELELNFDFISELPQLSTIKIYKFLTFESLFSLVRWLGQLESGIFYFRLNEESLRLSDSRQTDRGSIVWTISERTPRFPVQFESENPDEILAYLQELKSQILDSEASN